MAGELCQGRAGVGHGRESRSLSGCWVGTWSCRSLSGAGDRELAAAGLGQAVLSCRCAQLVTDAQLVTGPTPWRGGLAAWLCRRAVFPWMRCQERAGASPPSPKNEGGGENTAVMYQTLHLVYDFGSFSVGQML